MCKVCKVGTPHNMLLNPSPLSVFSYANIHTQMKLLMLPLEFKVVLSTTATRRNKWLGEGIKATRIRLSVHILPAISGQ